VPAVFLMFWAVKLLTTGIGLTGSDFLGKVSIPLAAVIAISGFCAALSAQSKAETYHPGGTAQAGRPSTPREPGAWQGLVLRRFRGYWASRVWSLSEGAL
jgi:hypothetical protein